MLKSTVSSLCYVAIVHFAYAMNTTVPHNTTFRRIFFLNKFKKTTLEMVLWELEYSEQKNEKLVVLGSNF